MQTFPIQSSKFNAFYLMHVVEQLPLQVPQENGFKTPPKHTHSLIRCAIHNAELSPQEVRQATFGVETAAMKGEEG
jgi:hypothetical protein